MKFFVKKNWQSFSRYLWFSLWVFWWMEHVGGFPLPPSSSCFWRRPPQTQLERHLVAKWRTEACSPRPQRRRHWLSLCWRRWRRWRRKRQYLLVRCCKGNYDCICANLLLHLTCFKLTHIIDKATDLIWQAAVKATSLKQLLVMCKRGKLRLITEYYCRGGRNGCLGERKKQAVSLEQRQEAIYIWK